MTPSTAGKTSRGSSGWRWGGPLTALPSYHAIRSAATRPERGRTRTGSPRSGAFAPTLTDSGSAAPSGALGRRDQLGRAQPARREINVRGVALDPEEAAARPDRRDAGRAGAREGIEDEIALRRARGEHAVEQRERLLGGVTPVDLLARGGRRDRPDHLLVARRGGLPDLPEVAHLLAAVRGLHRLVVEPVRQRLRPRRARPEEDLGRVREEPAGEVRRGVRLVPGDGVEEVEAELLHREADREDDVLRAGDPEGAGGLEHPADGGEPARLERVVLRDPARGVPAALVHARALPALAGGAAVREHVRGVREGHVHRVRRELLER